MTRSTVFRAAASISLAVFAVVLVSCGGQPSSTPKESAEASPAPESQTPPPAPAGEKPADTAQEAAPVPERHEPVPTTPTRKESKPAGRTETETAKASPAPAPPPPELVIKTVPAGTALDIVFLDGLSSASSRVGDSFRARVAHAVVIDGMTVIPTGSVVVGTVTEAVSLKKIGGQAKLTLDFSRLELPSGRTAVVHASLAQLGKSETKKDAATIGGAAAGGALLGRVLSKHDKGKGTVIGAIAGAAAGTAIAAKTAGHEIEIPAGTESSLQLDQRTDVTVEAR